MAERGVELWRGGGGAGDERAALPAASGSLRGTGCGGADRSAARPGLGPAGAGRSDRVAAGAVPDALLRLHRQALSRAAAGGAQVRAGYGWTKRALHAAGLVRPAPKRSAHRKKRPRRPVPGMMLHQDGSKHRGCRRGRQIDLIVTMDDATSEIYSAFLVEEEGTDSSLRGLLETYGPPAPGLLCTLYTDRGSHYFPTPEAGGKVALVSSPKSAGHWPSSASSTSRPTRRKPAAAWSACSAPSRAGCTRTGLAGIDPSRRPTASSPRFSCPITTPASRCRGRAGQRLRALRGRPGRHPLRAGRARPSAMTTACAIGAGAADPAQLAPAPLRQGQGPRPRLPGWNRSPSSTARAASPATSPMGTSRTSRRRSNPPPKPARRRARWTCWTTLRVAHNPTGPTAAADI